MGFKKGQSGNPSGRPSGSGNAGKLREAIEEDLPHIVKAIVEAAKGGDMSAAKLLLDRTIPAMKPIQGAVKVAGMQRGTLAQKGNAVVKAMGRGELSPQDAQTMLTGLANQARIVEADELEQRVKALEEGK